jgi:RNA polymerase sigma factor (sigma-70 family)
MEAYAPLVQREIGRYLKNPDDVAEITQEVFQAAHQQIDGFERRRPGALRRWLRMIARNTAISRLRKQEPQGSGDPRIQEMLAQLQEPLDDTADSDEQEHIAFWREKLDAAARAQHSERDFAVFVAVKRDGEAVRDVAGRFAIAEAQVYVICSRIARTLQNLAHEWADLLDM